MGKIKGEYNYDSLYIISLMTSCFFNSNLLIVKYIQTIEGKHIDN